jgi:hypothetical protein
MLIVRSFVFTPAFESACSTTLLEPEPNSRMSKGSLFRFSTLVSWLAHSWVAGTTSTMWSSINGSRWRSFRCSGPSISAS